MKTACCNQSLAKCESPQCGAQSFPEGRPGVCASPTLQAAPVFQRPQCPGNPPPSQPAWQGSPGCAPC